MTKSVAIVAGIVVLIIVAGWFTLSSQNVLSPGTSETANGTTPTPPGASLSPAGSTGGAKTPTKNTFSAIFAQPGDYECKYAGVDGSRQHNDVIYIADGKMRGEFRTMGDVADVMVYDGTYLYSWQEGKTAGTRTRLTSISQLPNAIPKDLTSAAVFGSSLKNISWDCHLWIKNASLLRVPSYVTF